MKLSYIFTAAFFISFCLVLFGDVGLLSAYRMSQEKAKIEGRIQRLVNENIELEAKIEAIQKDPIALEHEVRKSLSLVADGEILIKFQ
jgi:cell division protein FtsB